MRTHDDSPTSQLASWNYTIPGKTVETEDSLAEQHRKASRYSKSCPKTTQAPPLSNAVRIQIDHLPALIWINDNGCKLHECQITSVSTSALFSNWLHTPNDRHVIFPRAKHQFVVVRVKNTFGSDNWLGPRKACDITLQVASLPPHWPKSYLRLTRNGSIPKHANHN